MRVLLCTLVLVACGRVDTPVAVPAPVAEPAPHPRLSSLVQKKARALTLAVDAAPVQPADHIDILGTFPDPQTNELVTVTLVQNVIVLDARTGALDVLVVPEEAEVITHAAKTGSLTVTLRNQDDVDVVEERGRTSAYTLLSGERTRVLQQKRFQTIQVIRGSGAAHEPAVGLITRPNAVSGIVSTKSEPVSTFAADVDTASWSLARATLEGGALPEPDAVRVEEVVNAFDYRYRPPDEHAFGVSVDAFPAPHRPGWHLLHVGVKGRVIETKDRRPANLVFTIDVSGSMEGETRLELAKRAMKLLAAQLEEQDSVAIVAYGTNARVVLAPTNAAQRARITAAIDHLRTEGSTNVQAGLELAYATAAKAYKPGGINRVVLCSDGVANNGITDADGIFARVKRFAQEGITLTTVGFGMGSYNDALMERLADKGDGNYAYVDRFEQAKRVFVEQLTGTLQVIAKDTKFQLEFDREAVAEYRLVGYENRRLEKQDFANDKVDAGELGAGHELTAVYEVRLTGKPAARLAVFRARFKEPGSSTSGLVEKELPMAVVRERWEDATGAARLATVVALFAEKLRRSPHLSAFAWAKLRSLYVQLPGEVLSQAQVVELGQLMTTAQRLDVRGSRGS